MTAPEPVSYTWDGPFESAAVRLPSGRTVEVSRGESFEALPSETEALDNAPGFVRTASITPKPAADEKNAAKKESQ